MLHMNPREDGITFTHDSVAGLLSRTHCYEYIDVDTGVRTQSRRNVA